MTSPRCHEGMGLGLGLENPEMAEVGELLDISYDPTMIEPKIDFFGYLYGRIAGFLAIQSDAYVMVTLSH